MKFCRIFAVATLVVAAMLVAGTASAQLDPIGRITVPIDPTIESCAAAILASPGISCFTINDIQDPADIAGPTAAQINSDPNFDIVTNFIYEPTNCTPSSGPDATCPASDTLQNLFLAVIPTIGFSQYTCIVGATTGDLEPAFNSCATIGATPLSPPDTTQGGTNPAPGGFVELELSCNSTPTNPCTGMLPGESGQASVTPEPGTLLLLGSGLPLMGLFSWKRRKAVNPLA
jgi:PEP-CTERM motif